MYCNQAVTSRAYRISTLNGLYASCPQMLCGPDLLAVAYLQRLTSAMDHADPAVGRRPVAAFKSRHPEHFRLLMRPPRRSMVSTESSESRPSRFAVAARAWTRRPRPEGRQLRGGRGRTRRVRTAQVTGPPSCNYRAIRRGDQGVATGTHGPSNCLVSALRPSHRSNSQADSAGSIPVTRSHR